MCWATRAQTALKVSGNRVDVLVNNAGMYYPMSLEKGPNKGQGPLDGAPGVIPRVPAHVQEPQPALMGLRRLIAHLIQ